MNDGSSSPAFPPEVLPVRCATPGDIPSLRELFDRSRLEGKVRGNDTGADLEHLLEGYFNCDGSGFWVADHDGAVIGMIGVQRLSDNSAEMRRLRVREAYRRRGVGTRLMQHAIAFCREMQYLKVVLDVRIERSPAISMFDNFGFLHSRERVIDGRKLLDFYLDLYSDNTDTSI
jgi:ribosomal protein S18 acetylase RimI-like enzyme